MSYLRFVIAVLLAVLGLLRRHRRIRHRASAQALQPMPLRSQRNGIATPARTVVSAPVRFDHTYTDLNLYGDPIARMFAAEMTDAMREPT